MFILEFHMWYELVVPLVLIFGGFLVPATILSVSLGYYYEKKVEFFLLGGLTFSASSFLFAVFSFLVGIERYSTPVNLIIGALATVMLSLAGAALRKRKTRKLVSV